MAYKTVKELLAAICDAVRSKTGTTTSNVIDTGLSSISLFVLYIGSISAQGLVQSVGGIIWWQKIREVIL